MKKYVKNPQADVVILPGIGKITEGQEITGDYDQFVPQFLVEVPHGHKGRTLESTPSHNPRHLTEPAPLPGSPGAPSAAGAPGIPMPTGSPGTSATENEQVPDKAQFKGGPGSTASENAGSHSSPVTAKDDPGTVKDDHSRLASAKDEHGHHSSKDDDHKKAEDDKSKHKKSSSKGNE